MSTDGHTQRSRPPRFRPAWRGLPRVTRAHVALAQNPHFSLQWEQGLNAICSALGQEWDAPIQARAHLQPQALLPLRSLSDWGSFILWELGAAGCVAVLELEPTALHAWLSSLLGRPVAPGPITTLTRLEQALLSFACLVALAALRAQLGSGEWGDARLRKVSCSRDEVLGHLELRRPHLGVGLIFRCGALELAGRLLIPADALESALRSPSEPVFVPLSSSLAASPVPARCLGGRSSLGMRALHALREGDVICFEGLTWRNGQLQGPVRLCTPGFEWSGRLEDAHFSFSPTSETPIFSEEQTQVTSLSCSASSTSVLPVELEVELTRLLIPLGVLSALKPGGVLPLRIRPSDAVSIRLGDRVLAKAELVELEGELGARILQLMP